MSKAILALPQETIEDKIFLIRGHRVMIDQSLAKLYAVSVKRLNEQVRRNSRRFPADFMFQLTRAEADSLRSQIATLNTGKRGSHRKYLPYAFTEQGVAMLSGVLKSKRAIDVNVAVMRAFVRLRQILSTNKELAAKLQQLEQRIENHDEEIHAIFEAIRQLMAPLKKTNRRIGFHP